MMLEGEFPPLRPRGCVGRRAEAPRRRDWQI